MVPADGNYMTYLVPFSPVLAYLPWQTSINDHETLLA